MQLNLRVVGFAGADDLEALERCSRQPCRWRREQLTLGRVVRECQREVAHFLHFGVHFHECLGHGLEAAADPVGQAGERFAREGHLHREDDAAV